MHLAKSRELHSGARTSWGAHELALAQLERILISPHFHGSKRCSDFLRYAVEHALANPAESLKERTIGVEVFERPPEYDTSQDPVVRIAAGEVRKRLAQYYLEPGHASEPRITLPVGAYVPDLPLPVAMLPAVLQPRLRRRFSLIRWVAAGAAVVLLAAVLLLVPPRRSDLRAFWQPAADHPAPVLVCVGQPKAYLFQAGTQSALDRWFAAGPEGRTVPEELRSVPLSEFVPAWQHFIHAQDAATFERLSTMFARSGKESLLRGARSISLADLRGRPVVLVGAFNNEWAQSLAGDLRFYFELDAAAGAERVRDRQRPRMLDWTVTHAWPHRRIARDYAIVTRVRHAVTEQVVYTIGGITGFGTQDAGEFVTNPAYFAEALRDAPRDWRHKNLQVVLSTQVMSGNVGPPKVLAVHWW